MECCYKIGYKLSEYILKNPDKVKYNNYFHMFKQCMNLKKLNNKFISNCHQYENTVLK